MNTDLIQRMQSQFDELAQIHPAETGIEFWFARDLQEPLGYARRESFLTAIQRAIESCKTTGNEVEHHFRGVTKMVPPGSGAKRSIENFMPTLTIAAKNLATEKKLEKNSGRLPEEGTWG